MYFLVCHSILVIVYVRCEVKKVEHRGSVGTLEACAQALWRPAVPGGGGSAQGISSSVL